MCKLRQWVNSHIGLLICIQEKQKPPCARQDDFGNLFYAWQIGYIYDIAHSLWCQEQISIELPEYRCVNNHHAIAGFTRLYSGRQPRYQFLWWRMCKPQAKWPADFSVYTLVFRGATRNAGASTQPPPIVVYTSVFRKHHWKLEYRCVNRKQGIKDAKITHLFPNILSFCYLLFYLDTDV